MIADLDAKHLIIKDANTHKSVGKKIAINKGKFWDKSGENIQWADFSSLQKPGKNYLQIGDSKSYPFEIKEQGSYKDLSIWSLKAFYLWRASMDIEKEY